MAFAGGIRAGRFVDYAGVTKGAAFYHPLSNRKAHLHHGDSTTASSDLQIRRTVTANRPKSV